MLKKGKKNSDIDMDYVIRNRRHKLTFTDLSVAFNLLIIMSLTMVIVVLNLSRYKTLGIVVVTAAFAFFIFQIFFSIYKRTLFTSINTGKKAEDNIKYIQSCLSFFQLPIYVSGDGRIFYSIFSDNRRTQNLMTVYLIPVDGEILINFRNKNSFEIFNLSQDKQKRIIQYLDNIVLPISK